MEFITFEIKDRKAILTLNRPEKRNALHPILVTELITCLEKVRSDEAVKVVIIQAVGKAFCAGADLAYLQQLQHNSFDENLKDSHHLRGLFEMIYFFPKPVIAKVQGHAIAGGCGLASVCDFVYTVPEARFGYTEVKIGFVPAMVLVFLLKKIGEARATELLIAGDLITADRAFEIGLVHRVVKSDLLDETVNNLADQLIMSNSASSMQLTKKLIKESQELSVSDALSLAAKSNAEARAAPDCKKGIQSFLDKTPVSW